ncbi:MAG: ATP-binding cassette domain-containing protein [Prevotella sp.]|nr:ATP-binding cassette domain-containing protein [Bacteroides sp.]MCM1366221.1 ATP-binding cassette domain-containing protein [Prevotella sp.]MCM1436973.1 ATP-binding cassette domain-containing protein [Prevotella sp.]
MKRIHLSDTLPKVFENESIPPSDIWHKDVTFHRGEHYLIEAASGTGKSSLCAYIYGNRTDYLGQISFDDCDISNLSPNEWQSLRRTNIAYLPQELALFPELTAVQNIMLKNVLTGQISEQQIEKWLKRLGIDSRADYPVGKMSIGQQQRVAIIRTVCQPFDFILLDEPVSHLDEKNNKIAAEIILEEANRRGASIIATSVGNHLLLADYHHLKL